MLINNQENALQMSIQANLIEAFSQLRFLCKLKIYLLHNPATPFVVIYPMSGVYTVVSQTQSKEDEYDSLTKGTEPDG